MTDDEFVDHLFERIMLPRQVGVVHKLLVHPALSEVNWIEIYLKNGEMFKVTATKTKWPYDQ